MADDYDQILSRLVVIDRRLDTAFTETARQGATLNAEVAINRQILENIKDIKGIGRETMERMGELETCVALVKSDHIMLCSRITRLEKYAIPVIAVAIAITYVIFK